MKNITFAKFAKGLVSLLFLFGLVFSGVGIAFGLIQIYTKGDFGLQIILVSVCTMPIFGFLFMWMDDGMTAKDFIFKYIFLPIATLIFGLVIIAACIFIYSILSSTSATNILLFCIAILLAIIAFKK